MLPVQREQIILAYLADHNGGAIKELSEVLSVSEMTVRRDLERMERQGLILRSHGGAVLAQTGLKEPRFVDKQNKYEVIKRQLAAYAARHFVRDGTVLLLEGGTTVAHMADFLEPFRQLTMITNGMDTLGKLRKYASSDVVHCCGGTLREVSATFVGPSAEQFIRGIHADMAFLSASGFTAEAGFTDPNMSECQIKKRMHASAARTVILLDSFKFGLRSFVTLMQAAEADAVVTDSGVSAADVEHLKSCGVEVHIVDSGDA